MKTIDHDEALKIARRRGFTGKEDFDNVAVQEVVDARERLVRRAKSTTSEKARYLLFAAAELIRSSLRECGVEVRDTIGGATWERRVVDKKADDSAGPGSVVPGVGRVSTEEEAPVGEA